MHLLIVDDHDLVRDTLAAFIAGAGDFTIETGADVDQALARIADQGAFDLVLLDYSMPGMEGTKGLASVLAANGGNPVAVMSGTVSRQIADEVMQAGAIGFVPKTLGAKSLVNAVRFMASGEQFLPVSFMTEAEEDPAAANPLAQSLSAREREVLECLGQGLANKEIGLQLDLREVTVKLHVKTLCRKLGAKNRTQAALIGQREGLI